MQRPSWHILYIVYVFTNCKVRPSWHSPLREEWPSPIIPSTLSTAIFIINISTGLHWSALDFIDLHWISLICTGFCWYSLEFVDQHWISLIWTGFCWSVLDFTSLMHSALHRVHWQALICTGGYKSESAEQCYSVTAGLGSNLNVGWPISQARHWFALVDKPNQHNSVALDKDWWPPTRFSWIKSECCPGIRQTKCTTLIYCVLAYSPQNVIEQCLSRSRSGWTLVYFCLGSNLNQSSLCQNGHY